MDESVVYRRFRVAIVIVIAYTAAFALSDISWRWARENGEILSSLLSLSGLLIICWIPYTGLLRLLKRAHRFPRFQWVAFFLMISLPLFMLPAFKLSDGATGGWQYFLIPFSQLVLYGLLLLSSKILIAVDGRRSASHGT